MVNRAERQELLDERRRNLFLVNLLGLLLGGAFIVASVLIKEPHVPVLDKALEVLGTALVSAALISLAFGRFTAREATLRISNTLRQSLEETLDPLQSAASKDALSGYRWDCHVEGPSADDAHPDYGYQHVWLAYRAPLSEDKLFMICVSSDDEEEINRHADDHSCILRWMLDPSLDLADRANFRVHHLEIDGERVSNAAETRERGRARYDYEIPSLTKGGARHVAFCYSTRVFLNDSRPGVRARLFRTVTDAEFRLSAAPSTSTNTIVVEASAVSVLGPEQGMSSVVMPQRQGEGAAAIVQFRHLLQPGSVVAFSLRRSKSEAAAAT